MKIKIKQNKNKDKTPKISTVNKKRKLKNKNKKAKKKSKSYENKNSKKNNFPQKPKITTEKTAITNGEIELDQAVEDVDRYIIVSAKPSEYSDKYYAVTLNYTNIQNNNNKF